MRNYVILICLILLASSCRVKKDGGIFGAKQENFDEFNARFHKDLAFQLERIAFPIGGKSIDGAKQHDWNAKNWKMLKTPVLEKSEMKEYKHSLQKTDDLVVEKYWIDNSEFKVERQFKRIKRKWFLTYYNDVN